MAYDDSDEESNEEYIEEYNPAYVDSNQFRYARKKIQPSGHNKLFFLPNPNITTNQYNTFTEAKKVKEVVEKIPNIKIIEPENLKSETKKLVTIIGRRGLCRNIPIEYVYHSLAVNHGIIYYKRKKIGDINNDKLEEILGFATITLDKKNRENYLFLEIPLICANLNYKNYGTLLIKAIIEIAKNCGCKYIMLETVPESKKFYEKLGFYSFVPNFNIENKVMDSYMRYDILSDEEFKQTEQYKKAYENIVEFGGKLKKKSSKKSIKRKTRNSRKQIKSNTRKQIKSRKSRKYK
jgi:hypothetical protein